MKGPLGTVDLETTLAAGYGLFLVVVAAALELTARHAHRRSGRFHLGGFRYRRELDVFECPSGEALFPAGERGAGLRLYRARASVCNACQWKAQCTDSDRGREIRVSTAEWLETEVGRFHRAVSITLLVLAGAIAGGALLLHPGGADALVLLALAGVVGMALALAARGLRPVPGSRPGAAAGPDSAQRSPGAVGAGSSTAVPPKPRVGPWA